MGAPTGVNEMEVVGLEAAPSVLVKPPRVKQSPCALECKWLQTVRLTDMHGNSAPRFIAFGQVIGIHINALSRMAYSISAPCSP